MKKIYLFTLVCGLFAQTAFSQTSEEIVRYSRYSTFGTARSVAMGGAMGALGGDLSVIQTNPAGIGVYRKSEIIFSPTFYNTKSEAGLNAKENHFSMGNFGFVAIIETGCNTWKQLNFGFNYSRLNNYNKKFNQVCYDSENSLLDAYAYSANTYGLDDYSSGLAYDTWLINSDEDDFYSNILNDREYVHQYKWITEEGYQDVYNFSIGTNLMDHLYIGASVGIYAIKDKMRSNYNELGEEDSPSNFDQFNLHKELEITGTGTDFKIGIISRPIPMLRLGAAIHTPTFYSMSYKSFYTFESSLFNDPNYLKYKANTNISRFDYDMRTPWRAILSAAFVMGSKAIVSAEYEYVNYKSAKYDSDDADYDYSIDELYHYLNEDIDALFQNCHNFRLGAEYRINSTISARAGYNHQGSPYQKSHTFESLNYVNGNAMYVSSAPCGQTSNTYSCGVGFNFGSFYCDAAYSNRISKGESVFYDIIDIHSQIVHYKIKDNQLRVSFGWRF